MKFNAMILDAFVPNLATGFAITHNMDGGEATNLTVRRAILFGLTTTLEEDARQFGKGEAILADYRLACKIQRASEKPLSLQSEEVSRIKEKVGRVWTLYQPLIGAQVYGHVCRLLEEDEAAVTNQLGTNDQEIEKQKVAAVNAK